MNTTTPFSLTKPVISDTVYKLVEDKNSWAERELLSRVVALAASFFQLIDFIANLALAIGKTPLALLRLAGVKKLPQRHFCFNSIAINIIQSGLNLLGIVSLSITGAVSPKTLCYLTDFQHVAITGSMNRLKRLSQTTTIPTSKKTIPQSTFITYSLDCGRFGDQIINYIKAFQISKKYGIPILYKPIEYGEFLQLSKTHQHFDKMNLKGYKIVTSDATNEKRDEIQNELQKIKDTKKDTELQNLYEISYRTPVPQIDDLESRKALQELIKPTIALKAPNIPQGHVSVALHVRRGGSYDTQTVKDSMPTKFPPDSYYIQSLAQIAKMNPSKPLYARIFTDDHHPEKIKKRYEECLKELGINNVTIAFEAFNTNTDTALEDFFAMAQFDCLVRPDSSYSFSVSQIFGPVIEISPPEWGKVRKDPRNRPVIDGKLRTRTMKGGPLNGNSQFKVEASVLKSLENR